MKKGAVLLIVIMIVCAIVLVAGVSLVSFNISAAKNRTHYSYFIPMSVNADGCAEEALIRLRRNSYYEGENIEMGDSVCDIFVTGSGSDRNISVVSVSGDYTRAVSIDVIISPTFYISSWVEREPS